MDAFIQWLSVNPTASVILIISFGILAISVTTIYIVAFFQGREISFWPPTIGVREAAEKAVSSGEEGGVTITSKGDLVEENKINVGRDIAGIDKVILSYDAAYERVIGSTTFVLNQLEISYTQTREQAQSWFRFSLIAAAIGFVLVGTGVGAVIFKQVTAGVITAISSIIPNAAAALFFIQSKTANERVDVIQKKLTEARELLTAVEIANTIADAKSRDKLKAEIVRKALRIETRTKTNEKT